MSTSISMNVANHSRTSLVERGSDEEQSSFNTAGLVKKISTLAFGIFAIHAVSSIPVASAGPFAGGVCLLACIPLVEAPPLLALCIAACGVATTIPGP